MKELKDLDSTSERVDEASTLIRYLKFADIAKMLEQANIFIDTVSPHTVNLIDPECGFTMGHAITAWEIYRAVDVAEIIIKARDEYKVRMIEYYKNNPDNKQILPM